MLMQEHHYSLTELENMMPWERAVYVSMLIEHLSKKAKKERAKKDQFKRKNRWQTLHQKI